MADELKPCPFCGGEAEWRSGGPGCAWVSCKDCPAETGDGNVPRIAAAWNRRTPDLIPRADADLAALEAKTEMAALLGITCARDTMTGEPIMWGDADGDCLSPEVAVQCALEKIKHDANLAVAEERLAKAVEALQSIVDSYEATSELHTSSAECAANLYDFARVALMEIGNG